MKKLLYLPLFFALILNANAQTSTIDKAFQTATIERLCEMLNEQYVYPEVAKKDRHFLSVVLQHRQTSKPAGRP